MISMQDLEAEADRLRFFYPAAREVDRSELIRFVDMSLRMIFKQDYQPEWVRKGVDAMVRTVDDLPPSHRRMIINKARREGLTLPEFAARSVLARGPNYWRI